MSVVDRARDFAQEKHATQLRRYTGEPYFVHLEEVAGLVERASLSSNAIAAAWLHDVVEDQGVPIETICAQFGPDVALMVLDLTDAAAAPTLNRAKRKVIDRARLFCASAEAQGIKCADLISNTSTIAKHDPGFARVYLPEMRAILEVLDKAPASLRDQAWASLRQAEALLATMDGTG
jgi:(p)ppGpp synthase/HD superfamily hydrolase